MCRTFVAGPFYGSFLVLPGYRRYNFPVSKAICAGAFDVPGAARRALVQLARQTLEHCVRSGIGPLCDLETPALHSAGAFVTLRRKNGALRGCVGRLVSEKPLFETIAEMTRAAALEDPRFPPVTAAEAASLRISISLLSPIEAVDDPAMLQLGAHGLYIENGLSHGLLLPQVPVEQGWDVEEFLRQTCRKARLADDAWQQAGTRVACFTSRVIEEEP